MSGMVEGVNQNLVEAMASAMSPFNGNQFFKCSPELDKLFEALAAAQGEMESAKKSSNNPHFKSKYADIAEVIEACRPHLAKHGLAVVQPPIPGGVVTMLGHKSGQWIWSACNYKPDRDNVQGVGAAQTYGRRYGAQGMVFLPVEDDDGNTASGIGNNSDKGKTNGPPLNDVYDHSNNMHKAIIKGWWSDRAKANPAETEEEKKAIWDAVSGKRLGEIKQALGV